MKKYRHKETGLVYDGRSIVVGDRRVINPTEAMLLDAGYEVYEPVTDTYEPTEADVIRRRMDEIQGELSATDYLALKAFEGEDMSGHPGWMERRKALRGEYRELEERIKALEQEKE